MPVKPGDNLESTNDGTRIDLISLSETLGTRQRCRVGLRPLPRRIKTHRLVLKPRKIRP
jgi:hypothetical protein